MTVNITQEDDRLVITPVRESQWSLDDLLAGVTPDNIHHEIQTGPSVGNEE